ncbi:MAG TPA: leucyl aminopeptidase [Gaiellaceae bacterium]|jgi:leucyl aminopeptidase|nr:leucyl aminopeptidase [Gaiellaceae bacterium]
MRVEVTAPDATPRQADVVAVAVRSEDGSLPAAAGSLGDAVVDRVRRVADEEQVAQEAGRTAVLYSDGEVDARRLVAVGLGPADELDADSVRTAAAGVADAAERVGGTLVWLLDESLPLSPTEQARAVVDGLLLGSYDPGRWKTGAKTEPPFERLVLVGPDEVAGAAQRTARVAEAANRARDLANMGGNLLTPERLAARAEEIASNHEHVRAEALDEDRVRELGMGAFAGVAQGSHNPARMIVMRYEPPAPAADGVTLGLVGKAITFDTGGISIKPSLYMEDMKGDMAGGAAVIEGMAALAELEVPIRALAVVAATENMPGGGAYRPGDILTAMNGKTIEITNTDAEGRLVLADALHYARELGATHLLDFATLTGAMELAMGDLYAGVFGNDEQWRDQVVTAGEASGDHAWPWPMHRRYKGYIESAFADMKNSSVRRQASPAYAASFLEQFVGAGPWAHVDMAGTGFFTWPRNDYLSQKGGTGYGVRLIVELATRLTE